MPEDRYAVIPLALRICRLIAAQPLTRAELAGDLELHERTIRRIIDALSAAHVPIQRRKRGPGREPLEYWLPGGLCLSGTRPPKLARKPRK